MEKVVVALERGKFNYLYKYNFCHVSRNNVIRLSYEDMLSAVKLDAPAIIESLEYALPVFEQEHEVILIEVDNEKIGLDLRLEFNAVLQIIALNDLAEKLLRSRLNGNFRFSQPIPTKLYEGVKLLREHKIRKAAAQKVLAIFDLPYPEQNFMDLVKDSIGRKIVEKPIQHNSSSLDYLIDFDTTPSGIPEGNIEGFIKLVCVGMIKATGSTDKLRSSPLFNLLLENSSHLNNGSLFQSFDKFEELVRTNRSKFELFEKTLDTGAAHSHPYLLFYLFLSFKKRLLQHEFDLNVLRRDIDEGVRNHERALSEAIFLVGYIYSMGELYTSIQQNEMPPILLQNELKKFPSKPYQQVENPIENIQEKPNKFEWIQKPQGELFEVNNTNRRIDLIKGAKVLLKGKKKGKQLIDHLDNLYLNKPDFSYSNLSDSIYNEPNFMTKAGKPIQIAVDLLVHFEALNQ